MMSTFLDDNHMPVGESVTNWQPRPLPPSSSMPGRYCCLEPLNIERHSEDLFRAYASDTTGEGWTYLFSDPFTELAAFRQWLEAFCLTQDPQLNK